jgi:hypothetical protein
VGPQQRAPGLQSAPAWQPLRHELVEETSDVGFQRYFHG